MAAGHHADTDQDQTANGHLPPRHHHGIEVSGHLFPVDRGRSQNEGGDDDKAFPPQGEV